MRVARSDTQKYISIMCYIIDSQSMDCGLVAERTFIFIVHMHVSLLFIHIQARSFNLFLITFFNYYFLNSN